MLTIMTEWHINKREADISLLEALGLRVPAAPQAFLRQLFKKQRIKLDGCIASAEQTAREGARVSVKTSSRWLDCLAQSRVQPEQILYEDLHCLVLNKPAGLAIHRALGHDDNLIQRVQDFFRLRGEAFRVALIHRLDIGTSGAVLVGKGRAATSQLGQMFMAGQAVKHYLALVEGGIALPGVLSSAVPAKGCSKEALTRFRQVATTGKYSLLELELLTGRYHQVRHQLAAAGWPIVGDKRYHGKIIDGGNRPFLHCHRLTFRQPVTELAIDITCPLPPELGSLLVNLGIDVGFMERQDG
jgi:RluA family pseudouridine synthase